MRDSADGHLKVGQDQLDAEMTVNAVRSACKDLAKVNKGDVSGNTARILSVVLCAMQVTSGVTADDGHDEPADDDDSPGRFSTFIAWVMVLCESAQSFPLAYSVLFNILMIASVLMMLCILARRGAPSEVVAQSSPTPVRGARPKSVRKPVLTSDDERTMSPGAHDATSAAHGGHGMPVGSSDNPGSLSFHMPLAGANVSQARSSHSEAEGEDRVPHARRVSGRRAPPAVDHVWVSASQGYAYHRESCNKLRQASSAVKIPRPKALEKGYRPCKICKP